TALELDHHMLAAETVAAKRASAGPVGQICDRTLKTGSGTPTCSRAVACANRSNALRKLLRQDVRCRACCYMSRF
ncbi:hypothetical protein, partial [Acidisphaera sp. S103]|uniref:hypothetical protein n=1 Tax=Acidisphaera sp. S103 TaxID=1747223 RepID=UPI001C209B76